MRDHANVTAGQFYSAADGDGGLALCCPACPWEKDLTPWQITANIDAQLELAKRHLEEVRPNPLTS